MTRSSPHAVYDAQLATFSESGGLFSQAASPGFIELWSLQSRMAWRLRHGERSGRIERMGYKLLGFAVWQGSKWYVRRRMSGARRKVAIAGLSAAVIAGVVVRPPADQQNTELLGVPCRRVPTRADGA